MGPNGFVWGARYHSMSQRNECQHKLSDPVLIRHYYEISAALHIWPVYSSLMANDIITYTSSCVIIGTTLTQDIDTV